MPPGEREHHRCGGSRWDQVEVGPSFLCSHCCGKHQRVGLWGRAPLLLSSCLFHEAAVKTNQNWVAESHRDSCSFTAVVGGVAGLPLRRFQGRTCSLLFRLPWLLAVTLHASPPLCVSLLQGPSGWPSRPRPDPGKSHASDVSHIRKDLFAT